MTESITTDPKKAAALAQNIVNLLIDETSETRQRAINGAMLLLGEQPISRRQGAVADDGDGDGAGAGAEGDGQTDLAALFGRQEGLKASDYVYLCAAYYFSKHGPVPFTVKDLQAIAGEAGVMLPNRPDVTLHSAANKGKKMFQAVSKGVFKPTVVAGASFSERWGVKPGRHTKPSLSE